MRIVLSVAAAALLTACATQAPAPAAPAAAAPGAAAPAAKPAPQCWSGDHGKFFDLGTKTEISGVKVECKPTSDGKAAQWMGAKH